MTDNDRPQDVGRSHARKRSGGANAALIERWHAELRNVLDRCITELQGQPMPDGLSGPVPNKPVSISEAIRIVDLGSRASRELGSAIEPTTTAAAPAERARPRPRRVAY